jgi:site-specific DNA-methyltransferase (adenine-specific)
MDCTPDLRLGRWQDALEGVTCDALIPDPPYGERTHKGNADMASLSSDGAERRDLDYAFWTPADVERFVAHWSPRTRGWMACMTSDDLIDAYRTSYEAHGRLSFAPVPVLQHRPRLAGEGPGSGTVYLLVARPRRREFMSWGSLPCWYTPRGSASGNGCIGGKPLDLMRAIVRDYSRPGDLVVDPCAGGATTLLAAAIEGRRSIGSEMDADTYAKAAARLARGWTPVMRLPEVVGVQSGLDLAGGAHG